MKVLQNVPKVDPSHSTSLMLGLSRFYVKIVSMTIIMIYLMTEMFVFITIKLEVLAIADFLHKHNFNHEQLNTSIEWAILSLLSFSSKYFDI